MVFESFSQILDLRLEQVQRREIPIRSERCPLFDARFGDDICHGPRLPREVIQVTLLAYGADD